MLQTTYTTDVLPRVIVLLAAYNGLKHIAEQIDSILQQAEVVATIYVSVDASSDGTEAWVDTRSQVDNRIAIVPHGEVFGGAALNFFRILREVDFSKFDYVSFADQDDIWNSDKLIRHIQLARQHSADGVSSNVMAFWPDGSERLLDKAQPQKELDYLFESAGPGCTFLMAPWLVSKVCEQLIDYASPAKDVALHDWLTYAVCRAHGRKWVIDSQPSVRYRQHSNNVLGANVGLKAKWARLQKLRQGWYRKEVVKIAQVCNGIAPNNATSKLLALLNSKNYFSQLKLLSYVPEARRGLVDRCLLAISIIFGFF
jgi:rhamnosyltransferase